MSSSVADALTFANEDSTTETRVFIRLIDKLFDCLNVRCHLEAFKKRKPARFAYVHSRDERFKVHAASCSITIVIIQAKSLLLVVEGNVSELF